MYSTGASPPALMLPVKYCMLILDINPENRVGRRVIVWLYDHERAINSLQE